MYVNGSAVGSVAANTAGSGNTTRINSINVAGGGFTGNIDNVTIYASAPNSSVTTSGGGGGSSSITVTVTLTPNGAIGPSYNGQIVHLHWGAPGATLCDLIGDDTDIFGSGNFGPIGGSTGTLDSPPFSFNEASSGTITVRCYANSDRTGTQGVGTIGVSVSP